MQARAEGGQRADRIAVYTALFGGHDDLSRTLPQDIEVDWICFSDDADLAGDHGWQVVHAEPAYADARMSAKWFKALPHLALPEHRWTIWIDANIHVTSPSFAREALALASSGLGVFRHPQRRCIYREARASIVTAPEKYEGQPLLEQVDHYRREGFPERAGLFALGTIVRDRDITGVRELGRQWLAECERWSYQDQLSFPVVAWRLGLRPTVFPYHQHPHGVVDGFSCLLHRVPGVDAAAVAFRGRRPRRAGPIPVPPGRRRLTWPRSNPWWVLMPHLSSR